MKYFIALLALAAVASAFPQLDSHKPIAILRQSSDISPEGSYSYSYETENGISAGENGVLKAVGQEAAIVAQGSFAYTSDDGTPIQVSYVADENGFQPQGAHLPVAPAIPEAIQKAIEYIKAHPQPENQN